MGEFNFKGYADLLAKWVDFSQRHLYRCPGNEDLICYGPGFHTNWGIQTHAKATSAFATVACLEGMDLSSVSISKEELIQTTLSMIRYMLRTHLTGDVNCTNGGKWGHSWIYALSVERVFHAFELFEDYMSDEDKARLRTMMISESDYLLEDYTIVAGLVENNMPESNIWNGAILYRTAVLYPDAPNADRYMEKACRFFANGISAEADENSDKIALDKRIGDLFVGANMFDSFACNHHKYLNVGYMYICISNIAMLHFFLKSKNVEPHPIIYHNLEPLWKLVRATTFDDGRLFRIGGDSRARYSYCQDYALPSWLLIEDALGDDCTMLEDGWLKTLEKETEANGDGSFLSTRFGCHESRSPLYYTRLESDRANAISMALYWHKKYDLKPTKTTAPLTLWKDTYHGSAFSADRNRLASFTWRACELPQALIIPKDESTLAEWRHNLTGYIHGLGLYNNNEPEEFSVSTFEGGFLTSGSAISFSDQFLSEGHGKEYLAKNHIAFAALPDASTVLCIERAKTHLRAFITESAGVFWNIPNDIFNDNLRHIKSENGSFACKGGDDAKQNESFALGHYANVDERIGIASAEPLALVRRDRRQVDIKGNPGCGTLYCEEICSHHRSEAGWVDENTVLFDNAFAITLGDTEATKAMSQSLKRLSIGDLHAVSVIARNGKTYALIANFTDEAQTIPLDSCGIRSAVNLADEKSICKISLAPKDAVLLEYEA